jgi:ABC-type Fe3+/spermidine/putrescine transport system ATPase subunit
VTPALAATGLRLRLGRFQLGPLDLVIGDGEYLVLVGPSGAGKTVLLETLLGWHQPDAGDMSLSGRPVASIPPGQRRIAYVPQDLGLLPHLDVRCNITWGLDCRGQKVDHQLLATLTEVLALETVIDRPSPATLSRGEQQRVALCRALLTGPRLLAIDEPCAALDPHLRRGFQLLLRKLHHEHRPTVVHITHDREEAFLLGETIGVLLGGRLHQLADPRTLYDRPANAAVARFLSPENLWPGQVLTICEGHTVLRLDDGRLTLKTEQQPPRDGETVLVGIRPEEVMLLHPDRPLRPQVQANVVTAHVRELLRLDGRVQADLETDAGMRIVTRVSQCSADDLGLRAGCEVRASLKARSIYLLPSD